MPDKIIHPATRRQLEKLAAERGVAVDELVAAILRNALSSGEVSVTSPTKPTK